MAIAGLGSRFGCVTSRLLPYSQLARVVPEADCMRSDRPTETRRKYSQCGVTAGRCGGAVHKEDSVCEREGLEVEEQVWRGTWTSDGKVSRQGKVDLALNRYIQIIV
jgi:hypothetical protein